jgi:hypothetical protein
MEDVMRRGDRIPYVSVATSFELKSGGERQVVKMGAANTPGRVLQWGSCVLLDPEDERTPAALIIWKNPSGPIRRLAVSTPPMSAPMIPGKAASLPVRYTFRTGVPGRSQGVRYLSGVPG